MKKTSKTQTGSVTIKLGGKPLELKITAPIKPSNARRMLPTFQSITNDFVAFGTAAAEEKGKEISCRAGCGACCRQPVPISKAEAFQLAELIAEMPEEQRQRVTEKFRSAVSQLEDIDWFERFTDVEKGEKDARRDLSLEYFELDISCPFLEDESCSIHADRPMSCREYLVTSPAENCSKPKPGEIDVVEIPVTTSRVFREVADKVESGEKNYLPMIDAIRFTKTNQEKGPKMTGEQWVANFFRTLSGTKLPGEK